VRNERVKEEKNILYAINGWKANWIGHMVRRYCLEQNVIIGKIESRREVMGRQGKRCNKLFDDHKKARILDIDRRSNRSPSVEKSLGIWVWPSRRTDY
jgi:hypothetical protein